MAFKSAEKKKCTKLTYLIAAQRGLTRNEELQSIKSLGRAKKQTDNRYAPTCHHPGHLQWIKTIRRTIFEPCE